MRNAIFALVVILVAALAASRFRIENDLISSLKAENPQHAALFLEFHKESFFQKKIFVDFEEMSVQGEKRARIDAMLKDAGYHSISLGQKNANAEIPQALAAFLPKEKLEHHLSPTGVEQRFQEIMSIALLPGGSASLALVEKDLLGLQKIIATHFLEGQLRTSASAPTPQGTVLAYERTGDLNYEKVLQLYQRLKDEGPHIRFIGGDFYAAENYAAVQYDIQKCTLLSLLFTLVIFRLFIRSWAFLFLALAGNFISYLCGIVAVELLFGNIFAIVLGYTSTFLGFNVEYLVHLCGAEEDSKTKRGLTSAIGTTFIGFLILLFAKAEIVRQIAVISIGGMLGFLGFLMYFRSSLKKVTLLTYSWALSPLSKKAFFALFGILILAAVVLEKPPVQTDIEGFKYESDFLKEQARHFQSRLNALSLGDTFALPAHPDLKSQFDALPQDLLSWHPLNLWKTFEQQTEERTWLQSAVGQAHTALEMKLKEAGMRLTFGKPLSFQHHIDAHSFLDLAQMLSLQKSTVTLQNSHHLVVSLRPGKSFSQEMQSKFELVPLTPKTHYNNLLTALSKEMALLFAVGLCVMVIYLVFIQKSVLRVLYIATPLLVAWVVTILVFSALGKSISIIHLLGFSLVIALAVDYSSIAISTHYARIHLNKIMLTGLCTLAGFAVLAFAQHPVLREIGMSVSIGAGVSLAFSLFVRFDLSTRKAQES
jgi:hypothetical protein